MAICPFATASPVMIGGNPATGGTYSGGPFKIVHHTTEGPTIQGALSTYPQTGAFPHFTVDHQVILQHLDTSRSATAVKNAPGGVQTNRDSAVQIEVVGFASQPKSAATLANIARLCRWIEENHQVARQWPNGLPQPEGGHHNRNAVTWDTVSGHYGHSQVPENDHEDPGYTAAEVGIIMGQTDEVAVFVGGNAVANAHGVFDGTTVRAVARPIVTALGGKISAVDSTTVRITFRGQSIAVPAQGVSSGTSIIAVRELRRLAGVTVDFTGGPNPRIDVNVA